MPVTFEVEGKQIEVCMSTDSDFRGLGFFSALIGEFRISTCFFNYYFFFTDIEVKIGCKSVEVLDSASVENELTAGTFLFAAPTSDFLGRPPLHWFS